jgi:hypothetical protein
MRNAPRRAGLATFSFAVAAALPAAALAGALSVTPTSDHQVVLAGGAARPVTLNVVNMSGPTVSTGQAHITGVHASDFAVDTAADTCSNKMLHEGADCTVLVDISPTAPAGSTETVHLQLPSSGGATLSVLLSVTISSTAANPSEMMKSTGINAKMVGASTGFYIELTNTTAAQEEEDSSIVNVAYGKGIIMLPKNVPDCAFNLPAMSKCVFGPLSDPAGPGIVNIGPFTFNTP